MILKDYPYYALVTLQDGLEQLRQICKIRKDDIIQARNLNNVYVSGRKVAKIPSSSSDVAPTDRVGDQNYTDDAFYVLIDNAGTAEWRKATLSTF